MEAVALSQRLAIGRARIAAIQQEWLSFLLFCALVLSLTARIVTGWSLPFWFDEVYTGTIAAERDFTGALRWCLAELTGPAFYLPMWFWAKVAGTGNAAMRLPVLLVSVLGPLLVAWRGHPDRDVRLCWGIFSLLWLPMLPMSTEARAYPQVFLLASAQAIFFLRLATRCGLPQAYGWTGATALLLLTNYYGVVISAFQALALIAVHRSHLLKLFPAILPLLLCGAWMTFHLPTVLRFAAVHGSRFQHLPLRTLLTVPWFLFGRGVHSYAILILVIVTRHAWWSGRGKLSPEALLVLAGGATFALIFTVGLFRSTFTPRYLTAGIPALLLGLAYWAAKLREQKPFVVAAMLAIFFAATSVALVAHPADDRFNDRRNFEFETASAWLMERSPRRLYFMTSSASATSPLDVKIGGFFFARADRHVEVIPEGYKRVTIPAIANEAGGAVLLITYESQPPDRFMQWLQEQPSGWECRTFGRSAFVIAACRTKLRQTLPGPSSHGR